MSHNPTTKAAPQPAPRKPIFDLVRRMLGRGFKQSEVDALDNLLDESPDMGPDTGLETRVEGLDAEAAKVSSLDRVTGGPSVPSIRRKDRLSFLRKRKIGTAGTALIKRFEGCARLRRDGLVEAYPDPGTGAEPWTIGWGATGPGLGGTERIGPDTVWTQEQCDKRLDDDLVRYARDVERAIGDTPTSQEQFDAMVSFHYNTGAISRATLTKKHNAGDYAGAAAEFARWNKAGGRVLKGLVRRRAAEAKLYVS
ncbi:lysozyme [uncultured Erythrobacter sp.]|uniref:lysozyme n=1 Tax=uncultured Erythrobacter sp. TaxID=263913 RepID=UPI00261DC714|nr:lysozyme [uncultured Erythrobacter sp.]